MNKSFKSEFTYGVLTFLSFIPLVYIGIVIFYEYLIDSGIGTYLSGVKYNGLDSYQLLWVYGIIPMLCILEFITILYILRTRSEQRIYPVMLLVLNLILALVYEPLQELLK